MCRGEFCQGRVAAGGDSHRTLSHVKCAGRHGVAAGSDVDITLGVGCAIDLHVAAGGKYHPFRGDRCIDIDVARIGGEVDVARLHVLACGVDIVLGIQRKRSGHIQVGGAQEDIVLEGGDIQDAECGLASIDGELHTLGGGDVKPAGICQGRVRNDRDIPQRLDTGKVPDYQVAALELDVVRIVEVDVIQKAQIPLGLETQPEGAANHDLFQIFTPTPCECDVACPAAA